MQPKVLWTPSQEFIERAEISKYVDWLRENKGLDFEISDDPLKNIGNYEKLWRWSTQNLEEFWKCIWEYFNVFSHTSYGEVLDARKMPGAKWFAGAKLNYAEHAFRNSRGDREAIVYVREDGLRRTLSWEEIEKQTASFASWLREIGIGKGDRVAAYVSQIPEAVIALLGSASIGSIWVAVGAEMAPRAVIDRFKQLQPRILLAVDGYLYNGKQFRKGDEIAKIVDGVPSIERAILIPNLSEHPEVKLSKPVHSWEETVEERQKISFEPVPFDHPLWVLYSSGTTGVPKPIVHGHGGIIIETLKSSRFHLDIGPGDRFLWYSTPSWMMWNAVVNGLLCGATIVFYDGSPIYRSLQPLWEMAEKERLTFLGTSAPFLHACMKSGIDPGSQFNLKHLKTLGSTAAPLSPEGFEWVYAKVKQDLWLNSASGGTDVCTGFVGGCPILPVWSGEMQCRWLGVKVEAYNIDGRSVVNEIGELVIELPMPSMPLYFWGDPEFKWYRESYFEMFPGVWWHGDWLMITDRGTAIIFGRSDSTIKRKGVRMGTLDFYKVVESLPEVQNSMVVEVEGEVILFVVLSPGEKLDDHLRIKINNALKEQLGAYFVADHIIQVPDIPMTLNYKKLEVPMRKILMGWEPQRALNLESVMNPDAVFKMMEAAKPYLKRILKQS